MSKSKAEKKIDPTFECEGKRISYLNRDTEIFREIHEIVKREHPDVGAKNQAYIMATYFADAKVKKKLDELSRESKGKKQIALLLDLENY